MEITSSPLNQFQTYLPATPVQRKDRNLFHKCPGSEAEAVLTVTARVRKLARTPIKETEPQTSKRLSLWEAAEAELKKAQAHESVEVGLIYDLFRKTLKEDPELQWDRIVDDMHAKDPWEDLRGAKHNGLRVKSVASFWECIDFHKLTVYSVDAALRTNPSLRSAL